MNDADRCILNHFARVRNRTIELVKQLPDDLLARTAEGEEQSLFWLLVHIHHRGRIVLALLPWGHSALLGPAWLWPPTAD
ncbi:MAG: hypothetical protein FJ291_08895 [Planctomycetes bacterium]|nr:hypothetical protein [Planctomycetota bacterium]